MKTEKRYSTARVDKAIRNSDAAGPRIKAGMPLPARWMSDLEVLAAEVRRLRKILILAALGEKP